MSNAPPILEYAPPPPPPPPRGWLAQRKPVSRATFCVAATLPPLAMLVNNVLFSSAVPWWKSNVATLFVMLAPSVAVAFWPAMLVLNTQLLGTRPPPSSILDRRSATYVMATLAALIALIPYSGDATWPTRLTWLHLGILIWLTTDLWRHRLIGLRRVLPIVAAMLVLGVHRQHCPHTTTWVVLGVQVHQTGRPCRNGQSYPLWWLPDGR